jgi:hypothetical protein
MLNDSFESKFENEDNYHKKKLKETLVKKRDVSPFADVIEKGLANYMNVGPRDKMKLHNAVDRSSSKKVNKVYDYNKRSESGRKRNNSKAGKRPSSKIAKKKNLEKMHNALGLSESFDSSPSSRLKEKNTVKKHNEQRLEEVRRDQPDFHIKTKFI